MARTPETNEAFLREVDEELRRDDMARLWTRWGRVGLILVAIGLVLFGAFLWWRDHQRKQAGEEGQQLTATIDQLSRSEFDQAAPSLKALTESSRPGYRAAGLIAAGAVASQKGDAKAAAADFGKVAADGKVGQPFRDLALIRQTTIEFDTLPPDQVIKRMQPIAKKGSPWFGSAGELIAVAHLKAGRPKDAGALYAAIAADPGVPQTLRSRAAQMASVLGIDINPAALPSLAR